jgi:hypothetical protein
MFFGSIHTIDTVSFYNFLPRLFVQINIYTSGFLISHELFHKESVGDRVVGNYKRLFLRNAQYDQNGLYALYG